MQHLHMLQAIVTFSRSQIRCYVTIYAICHATLNFRIKMKKKITPNILTKPRNMSSAYITTMFSNFCLYT